VYRQMQIPRRPTLPASLASPTVELSPLTATSKSALRSAIMAPATQAPNLTYPYPDKLDYSKQAVEVPGTRKPGQTGEHGFPCVARPMFSRP
jgi:hypothetical protein